MAAIVPSTLAAGALTTFPTHSFGRLRVQGLSSRASLRQVSTAPYRQSYVTPRHGACTAIALAAAFVAGMKRSPSLIKTSRDGTRTQRIRQKAAAEDDEAVDDWGLGMDYVPDDYYWEDDEDDSDEMQSPKGEGVVQRLISPADFNTTGYVSGGWGMDVVPEDIVEEDDDVSTQAASTYDRPTDEETAKATMQNSGSFESVSSPVQPPSANVVGTVVSGAAGWIPEEPEDDWGSPEDLAADEEDEEDGDDWGIGADYAMDDI
eukprot:TRINITY_DN26144_c0_g1_i2.p1 TRINITY_DN26144_c0_g1~~TRINITY_DN26144_c0_g1_i2.p1  ORF type:complete len:262 (-),score=49.65 TRINITY_DN26144_c0_g1_i2:71-856(-)